MLQIENPHHQNVDHQQKQLSLTPFPRFYLYGERLLREPLLIGPLHQVEQHRGRSSQQKRPPIERIAGLREKQRADNLQKHVRVARHAPVVLQLRASDVERGGGGEGGDDRLGEKPRDHATATNAENDKENAADQAQRAHSEEVVLLVGVGVDKGQSAAHHHRDQSEGTDVDVARCAEQTIHEHGGDAPIESVDGREIGQHGVGHTLGVREEKGHAPEELP